jgi:protein-tyrosine phosphatase
LRLEGIHNFRDLGGHVTPDGLVTKPGMVYRSAELIRATEADAALLVGHCGVKTFIDLRTASERAVFGTVGAFAERPVHLPLLDEDDLSRKFSLPDLGVVYDDLLRRRHVGERLVSLLAFLAEEGSLPAVLFCSAGKDRTGLAASAILGALGVADDAVAEDYATSDAALQALYAIWAEHPASTIGELLRTHPHLLGAPQDAMTALLVSIRRDWGSMRGYLAAHGAGDDLFDALAHALLEQPGTAMGAEEDGAGAGRRSPSRRLTVSHRL